MSKSIQAWVAVAVVTGGMIFTLQSAQAGGCGTHVYGGQVVSSCHTPVYSGYSLFEMKQLYVLFHQNPILCQRHPQLALELNNRFNGNLVIPGVQAEVAVGQSAVGAGGTAVVATPGTAATVVADEAAVVATPASPIASGPVTSGPVTSGPVTSGPVTPDVVTPDVVTPDVVTPATAVAGPAIDATPTDLPAGGPVDLPAGGPVGEAPITAATPIDAGSAGVPSELEPLLGLWENEGGSEEIGSVSQINLSKDGTATVTLNTAIGPATMVKPFAVEDSNFNLIDGERKITLGQVLSADADRVVLKSGETTLTFTRPS